MLSEAPIKTNMIFRLSNQRSPKEVSLKSLEWAVVTQLNGEKTVGQIGETLSLSDNEVLQIFSNLLDEGLLEYVRAENSDNAPSPAFINRLEKQFKMYVGPIADIIINDTLTELKTSRQYLDKGQIPFFVEILSLQISSQKKRIQFQKDMLNEIKEMLNGR
jgi:hypothetical protein